MKISHFLGAISAIFVAANCGLSASAQQVEGIDAGSDAEILEEYLLEQYQQFPIENRQLVDPNEVQLNQIWNTQTSSRNPPDEQSESGNPDPGTPSVTSPGTGAPIPEKPKLCRDEEGNLVVCAQDRIGLKQPSIFYEE